MAGVKLNYEFSGITEKEIMRYKEKVLKIHKHLHEKANDEKEMIRLAGTSKQL